MTRSARIDRFIRRWHRRPWSVATLPDELGALVGYVSERWSLLGCCHVKPVRSVIALNASLIGTNFLIPVLAHECAHVLIGIRGMHGCAHDQDEANVWALAARLAVPETVSASIRADSICSADVARSLELPVAFVRFAAHGDALLPGWLDELKYR